MLGLSPQEWEQLKKNQREYNRRKMLEIEKMKEVTQLKISSSLPIILSSGRDNPQS